MDTETWVGQQLASAYDGDLTVDAIREFATEKGVALSAPPPPAGEVLDGDTQQVLNTAIQENVEAQAKVANLTQGTQPRTAEAPPEVQAQQALMDGRVQDSIALKAMQIRGER